MSKVNYQAVLSSGEVISRSSARTYSHAWVVKKSGKIFDKGFSSTKELAEKSSQSVINFMVSLQLKKDKESLRVLFSNEVVGITVV